MKVKSNHSFELYCKGLEVKEVGEDSNSITIEGFANTTTKDRQGDVILEEAWTKGGLDNYLKNPIVLAYHNPERPIGEVTDYGVNNKGLHVKAEISSAAGDVYEFIKKGMLKAFSVGFRVKDADYDKDTDIFVIKDLEMYELSVVSIPANADSIFSVRKSFETEEDFTQFKQLYTKQDEIIPVITPENVPVHIQEVPVIKENIKVDKTFTQEELDAAQAAAVEKALADIEAKKLKEAELEALVVKAGKSGEERLVADFEAKLAEKDATVATAMEEFRAEMAEKNAEVAAFMKSKMTFENPASAKSVFSNEEIDTAVLTAKAMGVKVDETKYYKDLLSTKADQGVGGAHSVHIQDTTTPAEWETLFSTRMYEDIKDLTVIEPLFRNKVKMNSRVMTFPYNPDAGLAAWVQDGAYRLSTSTGTEVVHKFKDNTIKAEKLAAKEYLGYEEEEDSIIALMPIIRDAVMRRMVRSTDTELLRANNGSATSGASSGAALIDGISTLASDVVGYGYVQPGAFGDPTTIADLQQTRRLMGAPGLMPGDLVYVVSQAVYFDILEDPDFRTMDLVGANATILRGQVGSVNGSPVVISDAFAADAIDAVQAVCFNAQNYLFGELRGLMVERDRDIEYQKNIIVATRRFGMTEIVPAVAAATKRQSYCANFVRPAA